jgi:hypothetical protein
MVIEYGSTTQLPGNGMFVSEHRFEIRLRTAVLLDGAGEAVEAGEALELVGIAHAGAIERSPQDRDGFIVGLERHREGMAILAP